MRVLTEGVVCSMLLPSAGRCRLSFCSCLLMTAFVKATARLFLGPAVNTQIPHLRLGMFSIWRDMTERKGDGEKPGES